MSLDDDLIEEARWEVNLRVLEADTQVSEDAVVSAESEWYRRTHPDSDLARSYAELMETERRLPAPGDGAELMAMWRQLEPDERALFVEEAAYSWRRDYGEWPTWHNLVDRLASDRHITHDEAASATAAALGTPTTPPHLYAIAGGRMAEILEDLEPAELPIVPGEMDGFRLYVSREGIKANHLAESYASRKRTAAARAA